MDLAHVICANDSVEHVFIGAIELAEQLKERLAEAEFNNPHRGLKHVYENNLYTGTTPYERYRNHVYWHVHTVPVSKA